MSEKPAAKTRYPEIARCLRGEITEGRYGPSGKLPSESMLVKRFGVSRPTVARALAALVEEGLVERRAGSGSFVKAGGAAAPQSNILALLIPNLANVEIFQMICGELSALARMHDHTLVWGSADQGRTSGDVMQMCRQLVERKVSGVFFAPYEWSEDAEEMNRSIVEMLHDAGIPVVLLDRDWPRFPLRSDLDLVDIDNFASGFMLAEHLIKLGCRRLHFVTRPRSAPTVRARMAGVCEALAGHGISPDPGWKREGAMEDKKFMRGLTMPLFPDAYICANDNTAALLLSELRKVGVKVPETVRVVGFDDVKFATLVSPPLTTMSQPCREIAQVAFRAMLDRQADPTLPARRLTLTSRLVIRDSCGAYLGRS